MFNKQTKSTIKTNVEIPKTWPSDVFLHGSKVLFLDGFDISKAYHGVLYFSKPKHRKTQAEYIAEGPFGRYLYVVKLILDHIFDPMRDPKAQKILDTLDLYRRLHDPKWRMYYQDAPEIIQTAKKYGYKTFMFWEPAVQDYSYGVTDDAQIKIIDIYDVKAMSKESKKKLDIEISPEEQRKIDRTLEWERRNKGPGRQQYHSGPHEDQFKRVDHRCQRRENRKELKHYEDY